MIQLKPATGSPEGEQQDVVEEEGMDEPVVELSVSLGSIAGRHRQPTTDH